MIPRRFVKLALGASATVALTVSALVLPSSGAHAAGSDIDSSHSAFGTGEFALVMGQMVLDCENMSPSARAYATEHGLCSTDGDVGTQNIRYGSCGYSYIYVFNNAKSGVADFSYGFGSDLGPVVYRSLRVNWTNVDTLDASGFNDNSVMAGTTYQTIRSDTTGAGDVLTGLIGSVTLLWGGVCTLLVPTDIGTIW